MVILKGSFLEQFNKRLNSYVSKHSSFVDLYNALIDDKFKMSVPFDYASATARLKEIKEILEQVYAIIYSPAIVTIKEETIMRSEISGRLSSKSFDDTMKDASLWKNKDGEMTPEYVHNEESIDSIITYENMFVFLLVNLIDHEVRSIYNDIVPIVPSIEERYEIKGISYGKYSFFKNFESFNYPYHNVFEKEKTLSSSVFKLARKAGKMLKNIKGSEFYRVLSHEKSISKEIMPTNILLHDPRYSLLYRFYVRTFMNRESESNYLDNVMYYNYAILLIFTFLAKQGIGKTSLSKESVLSFDDTNRLRFSEISFKKGMCAFFLKEDEHSLGIIIEVCLIEKAVRVNSKVPENQISKYYLLFSKDYDDVNGDVLDQSLAKSNELYEDSILVSMNNVNRKFEHVLKLTYYDEENISRIQNMIMSFGMLFDCDSNMYIDMCPVCGRKEIKYDKNHYCCEACNSNYSLLSLKSGDFLWIKSFRRQVNGKQ